jgi:hypothetical protein
MEGQSEQDHRYYLQLILINRKYMKTKMYISWMLILGAVSVMQAQTMRWIPTPAQSVFGKCSDQSTKSGLTQCYTLEYVPAVTGVLTSYTTGFLVSCTSLGSAIAKNQSCTMTPNNREVNGCDALGKVLMNSSGNSGTIANSQIQAGVPVLLHQVCLTIPTGESVSMEEDPVTDLTTSVDLGNGSFVTEFPTFTTATFRRIRYDAALHTAFLDFQGVPAGDQVSQLDWSTSSDNKAVSFTIERSFDDEVYEAIGELKAGEEASPVRTYQFFDRKAQIGSNFYRLVQTSAEGEVAISPVREIRFEEFPFEVSATPNPAKDLLFVRIMEAKVPGTVKLLDVSGKERLNTTFEMNKLNLELEVSRLEAGIYTLQVNSGLDSYTEKIVVIK